MALEQLAERAELSNRRGMWTFVLTCLLACADVGAQSPQRVLWGSLEPGRYAVGFRQLLVRDPSRPSICAPNGQKVDSALGRQMQLLVWYPAVAAETGRQQRYGDYLDLLAQELNFAPISVARRHDAEEKFIAAVTGFGSSADSVRGALPRLRALPVAAHRDARPAAGRFPVLLFP